LNLVWTEPAWRGTGIAAEDGGECVERTDQVVQGGLLEFAGAKSRPTRLGLGSEFGNFVIVTSGSERSAEDGALAGGLAASGFVIDGEHSGRSSGSASVGIGGLITWEMGSRKGSLQSDDLPSKQKATEAQIEDDSHGHRGPR
jgi:hypothetical protein